MRGPSASLAVLAIALVSAVCGFAAYRWMQPEESAGGRADFSPPPESVVGALRPGFTLPDLEGTPRSVSEWDGKVLALNFWATWCPPCRTEIPEFIALQRHYGDRGLQFVGIALQPAGEAAPFARELGMNYPVLAGEQAVVEIARAYGNRIGALPYTVLIDRSGRIAYVHAGPLPREEAESRLLPLL